MPKDREVKKPRVREKPKIKCPNHWTGDKGKSTRLQAPEAIKQAVQSMMNGTWKNCVTRDRYTCGTGDAEIHKFEVVQVITNQNPKFWKKYVKKRDDVRGEIKGKHVHGMKTFTAKTQAYLPKFTSAGHETFHTSENEMLLFHGTKPSAADAICETHFDVGKSNPDGLFGQGLYFAESSSKSDEYVKDEEDGIYQGLYATLLCRVHMGKINYDAQLKPDPKQLMAPVKRKECHSVLGDREKVRGTYREFIIYNAGQVYVEYIVIYRRVDAKVKPGAAATPKPVATPTTKPTTKPMKKKVITTTTTTTTVERSAPRMVSPLAVGLGRVLRS